MDYRVVFSGKIHESSSSEQVRENFARLFRQADAAKLDRLFSGQAVTLKKGLTADDAERYRQALLKAGAVCEIRRSATSSPEVQSGIAPSQKPAVTPPTPTTGLSLMPLEEKPEAPSAEATTSSGLSLSPMEKKAEPVKPAIAPPANTSTYERTKPSTVETNANDRSFVIKGSGADYGDLSIMPDEVRGLCWGGFFMPWIWGTFNGVKISFLALPGFRLLRRFIPAWILMTLSLLMSLFMLIKGRELAWKNRNWDSVEHFNRVQRRWTLAGVALAFILAIAVPLWISHELQQKRIAEAARKAAIEAQTRQRQEYLDSIQDPAEREQAQKEFEAEDAQLEASSQNQ